MFRQLNALATLTPETQAAFGRLFSPQNIAKHDFFVRAGDSTHTVAFVISGIFRCFATSPDGVEYNKTFFIENDLMGIYYALLLNRPSPLSVQALTPCSILTADFRQIEALYDQHPTLERLARRQAEHLFLIKEQREIDLVMLDAKARYEKFQRDFPTIEQAIPQYHIASHLGITPTQLSRIRAGR